jgi:hypothetical protein
VTGDPLSMTDNATPNRRADGTRPETHQNLIHPDKEQQTKNNRRFMTIDVAGRFSLKNTPPRSRDLSARYSFALEAPSGEAPSGGLFASRSLRDRVRQGRTGK